MRSPSAAICLVAFALPAALPMPALAADGGDSAPGAAEEALPELPDSDRPVAHPDAADLRAGHWILAVDGGVWSPSSGLTPSIAELGAVNAGGALGGHLGLGLGRNLVLNLVDGGFAYAPTGSRTGCTSCGVYSITVGPSLELHPVQGFAFDPWLSYGMGYRHTILALDSGDERVLGMDVARLALGGSWFPAAWLGFGPYLGTDIGVRTSGAVSGFGVFHAGLRITLDAAVSSAAASDDAAVSSAAASDDAAVSSAAASDDAAVGAGTSLAAPSGASARR